MTGNDVTTPEVTKLDRKYLEVAVVKIWVRLSPFRAVTQEVGVT